MIKRWLSFAKTRDFYFKLIASILIVSIIPVFVISVATYINVKATLEEEILEANVSSLHQTISAVEIIIDQMNNSCSQLSLDPALTDFFNV